MRLSGADAPCPEITPWEVRLGLAKLGTPINILKRENQGAAKTSSRILLRHPESSWRPRFLSIDKANRLGHNRGSTDSGG